MSKKFLKPSQISLLPKSSGVYLFFGEKGKPLYIGKSSNLRERVRNHFKQFTPHRIHSGAGPNYPVAEQVRYGAGKDSLFIYKVKKIGCLPLKSEIEALIEEARLIKKYQPKFNVMFKDDKNYFYVGITKEDWPRVFITHQLNNKQQTTNNKPPTPLISSSPQGRVGLRRGRKLSVVSYKLPVEYIGPFVGGSALKGTLKILRKTFPYRTCKTLPRRPCLWHQLNRCPAPCLTGREIKDNPEFEKQFKERKKDYEENIKKLKLILKKGREKLILELKKEMKKMAKLQEFERAAKIRDKIEGLEGVFSHRFLFQPKIEVGRGDVGKYLRESLSLPGIPERIEGYDISQISGKGMVGSMTVFSRICTNLTANFCKYTPNKKEYRLFRIKKVKIQNDTACLKEVLQRRFNHSEWIFPDLIYIDGGKAQFNAAKSVIRQAVDGKRLAAIPIIALAKRKNILYNDNSKFPVFLDKLPQTVKMLILRLRDESHRFAISFHRKLRSHEYKV